MTASLVCTQPGCPFVTEGNCLEGFEKGRGCPNLQTSQLAANAQAGSPNTTDDGDATDPDEGVTLDEDAQGYAGDALIRRNLQSMISIGGDDSMTLSEADEIAAHSACRVVLIAGEFESGKTTLAIQLYAQFLQGPFAGADFGGSRTLRAFDGRHHPSRAASGRAESTTNATRDEGMRLLHLKLRRGGRINNILLSDVRGEYFENIVNGSKVAADIELAARADLCLIAIDGAALAIPAERQRAISRARLLIGGLTEFGGLRPGTVAVVVVTKSDLLDDDALAWVRPQLENLREEAATRGVESSTAIVAARPERAAPQALDTLLEYVLPEPAEIMPPTFTAQRGDRQFWNQPNEVTNDRR